MKMNIECFICLVKIQDSEEWRMWQFHMEDKDYTIEEHPVCEKCRKELS